MAPVGEERAAPAPDTAQITLTCQHGSGSRSRELLGISQHTSPYLLDGYRSPPDVDRHRAAGDLAGVRCTRHPQHAPTAQDGEYRDEHEIVVRVGDAARTIGGDAASPDATAGQAHVLFRARASISSAMARPDVVAL